MTILDKVMQTEEARNIIKKHNCPSTFGFPDNIGTYQCAAGKRCEECWNKQIIEEDSPDTKDDAF